MPKGKSKALADDVRFNALICRRIHVLHDLKGASNTTVDNENYKSFLTDSSMSDRKKSLS